MPAIAVCGPPHSGKSVLIAKLYDFLRNYSIFVQRACPDGEGQWSAESDPEIVKKIRKKGEFDYEFIESQNKSIERLKEYFDVVLVDFGGLPTPDKESLLEICDCYILLDKMDDPRTREWKRMLEKLEKRQGLYCIAHLITKMEGEPRIISSSETFKAILVNMDRSGVPSDTLSVISLLAEFLKEKFKLEVISLTKFSCNVLDYGDYLFVDVSIGGNTVMSPDELGDLLNTVRKIVGSKYYGKGVVISGRLPVWAHCALTHLFHASKFVAHFDPRFKGGVVVAAHDGMYRMGQIIPVEIR